LRLAADQRLGKIGKGLLGGDRWFTDNLAGETKPVPLILLKGAVTASGGEMRANGIQILGVESRFWTLSLSGKQVEMGKDGVAVNEALANQLHLKMGNDVLIRLEKPSAISRDAPLSGDANQDITLRRKVSAVVSPEDFGAFQLTAAPASGGTLFLPLADLQAALGKGGHVNTLLAAAGSEFGTGSLKPKLEDFSLHLAKATGASPEWQVTSDRIFLDEPIARKLLLQPGAHGVLTYLVNSLTAGKKSAAYSFVTADMPVDQFALPDKPGSNTPVPADIIGWLADDLGLGPGGQFAIRYFTFGVGRGLNEESATLAVRNVIHMDDPIVNKSWTPDFPGVSEAKNCRDWKPGIPMKLDTIRDKDEAYWNQYKATPKAFIPLAAGQKLWGNRFGNLTGIRFPDRGEDVNKLSEQLVDNLSFGDIGLTIRDFKTEASAAAKGSVDFGGLFIGLSLFIISAALVFSILLFLFTLEKRIAQFGLLFALGLRKKSARALLLGETSLVAIFGSGLGLLGGMVYTKLALKGLNGVWEGAAAGLRLVYAADPMSMGIAFVATLLASLGTLAWASRSVFRQKPVLLLAGDMTAPETDPVTPTTPSGWRRWFAPLGKLWRLSQPVLPWLLLVLAVALSVMGAKASDPEEIAGMFFGGGFCLLGCGLMLGNRWLKNLARGERQAASLGQVGLRNVTRRPGRSLAVMGMMAGGIFLVIAVNAFRLGAQQDGSRRDTGTGGFALIGESTLPVYGDLNAEATWDAFALDEKIMHDTKVVPFRMREGDDASCLNLNKAQQPVLCGVNPKLLAERKAFAFASGDWTGLLHGDKPGANEEMTVPGVADQATAEWGLGKGLGDVIDYTDGRGKVSHVRLVALLAGSVLQGKVIVNESDFLAMYPDAAGYKFFLVDVKSGMSADKVAAHLTRQLEARGLALEPVSERLAAFEKVQNTYIGIFTILGGLGVLLGTAGLGVLAARNILERRGEFGLMLALGFKPAALRRMVLSEHLALLIGGLLLGLLSAAIAVWPDVRQSGGALPWSFLLWLNVGILAFGAIVCWIAAASALHAKPLEALRRE
jgi:ABC-type antimicrobial peptide transport system permease subunit